MRGVAGLDLPRFDDMVQAGGGGASAMTSLLQEQRKQRQ
jgi:hypothetical protein